ncbi:MAG: hypothetical protein RIT02_1773, partial [Planctomycetota bacterium]
MAVLHCALHLTLSRIKLRSQNNLPCVHRSQPSRHCFQPPLTPPDQRFVFRVFRGERWFRVENTIIEQVYARLARAKAQATVSGPWCHECSRNPRSRHSAFFRVLPRPKQGHTRDSFSVCSVCSVVSDGFGLKTALSNKWMRDLPGLKPRLRFLAGGGTNARAIRGHVIPRSSAFFCVLLRSSAAKKRHTHDSCSVCSVVSHGFGLKTALSNKCVRNLPGLNPGYGFWAVQIGVASFRVIQRSSAAKKRINAKSCAQLQTAWPRVLTAIVGGRNFR